MSQEPEHKSPGVGLWPGRRDMYFDLSVAGVWNISRTARLLLIEIIQELLSKLTSDGNTYNGNMALRSHSPINYSATCDDNHITQATCDSPPNINPLHHAMTKNRASALPLIQDIMSSIPFHLAEDIHAFVDEASIANTPKKCSNNANPLSPKTPGRRAGGLLILHPLCESYRCTGCRARASEGMPGLDCEIHGDWPRGSFSRCESLTHDMFCLSCFGPVYAFRCSPGSFCSIGSSIPCSFCFCCFSLFLLT